MSNKALDYVFDLDLPPTEKFVLVAMADRTNDKRGGVAWPGTPKLQKMTGFDRRTVQRALKELQKLDLLEQVEAARGRRSARWRILGRGGAAPPKDDRVGAAQDPVGAAQRPLEAAQDRPNPIEPSMNPHSGARKITTAEDLVDRWAELTGTPLTRKLQRSWYTEAVEFVAAAQPELLDNTESFLTEAHRQGCRTPGGWVHFVAGWTRARALAGRGAYPTPEADEWEPADPDTVREAVGRLEGETATEMLRRIQ